MEIDADIRVLLTVGGEGFRLKSSGYPVPISKSFLEVNGKPLVFWNLLTFKRLGVNTLVICAEHEHKLDAAAELISSAGLSFSRLEYHCDDGLGTAGLPFHCRDYFDGPFIFVNGHSIVTLEHYIEIVRLKSNSNAVASTFELYDKARGVFLSTDTESSLSNFSTDSCLIVDNPISVDEKYLDCLARNNFHFRLTLQAYHDRGKLLTVKSELPAEIDEVNQLDHVAGEVARYLAKTFPEICGK